MSDTFQDRMLDNLVAMAVKDALQQEIDALPPENEIEHVFSDTHKAKMRRIMRTYDKTNLATKRFAIFPKIASFLILTAAISLGTVVSVEASRVALINTVREFGETSLGIKFGTVMPEKTVEIENIRPTYIPSGFSETSNNDNNIRIRITYENDAGDIIVYEQMRKVSGVSMYIDSEHSIPYKRMSNTYEQEIWDGTPVGYTCYVMWETQSAFYIVSAQYNAEELIKMADSITAQLPQQ